MTDADEFYDLVATYPTELEDMIGRPYTEENMRHVIRLIKERVVKELAETQPLPPSASLILRPITMDISRLPELKPLRIFDDET